LKTTIVLPTYNEAENLPDIISSLFNLPVEDLSCIIIDDNSPDHTGEIADRLALTYPGRVEVVHRQKKAGIGSAYTSGFRMAIQAGAEAVGQMDSDFSHPVDKLVPMLEALKNCDVAIGSRYIAGGSLDNAWPFWRKCLSGFGNYYARTILQLPMHDITGGFRLYSRETLQKIPLERVRSNGYIFQVEIAYIAKLLGLRFIEIPIYFAERKKGKSKMSLRIQLEAAWRVWQLLGMYDDLKHVRVVV
jgi:dolichol-phosphate mannosyltransferase